MEVSYRDFLVPVTRRESLVSFRLAFDGIIKLLTVEISQVPLSVPDRTPAETRNNSSDNRTAIRGLREISTKPHTLDTSQAAAIVCAVSAARFRSEEYTAAGLASLDSRWASFRDF